jgi:hypothetical protein
MATTRPNMRSQKSAGTHVSTVPRFSMLMIAALRFLSLGRPKPVMLVLTVLGLRCQSPPLQFCHSRT